jgi:hypothetical protein
MKTDVTAVPALAGVQGIGALTFWRLSGRTTLAALCTQWLRAGLDPDQLPQASSPKAALRAALHELEGTRVLARPLHDRGDWVLQEEAVNDDTTAYTKRMRVRVSGDDALVIEPADHPDASRLREAYRENLSTLSHANMGGWLVGLVEGLRGVSLKDTGGVYFVPEYTMREWRQIITAVEASSGHVILEIPAVSTEKAAQAVTMALVAESEQCMRAIREHLEYGDLGVRALESKQRLCRSMQGKIGEYEAVLGVAMGRLHEQVTDLETQLVAATLAAEAEDDGQ